MRTPNANAYAERWVGSLRRECLDRLPIINRRQPERILRVYVRYYNGHRPHRALDLRPPTPTVPSAAAGTPQRAPTNIERHDLLGGLLRDYRAAA